MTREAYEDDIFILRVEDWQTADKYAVCFSRNHGKIAFLAFGARYPKNTFGRLVQPFAQLHAHFTPGRRLETLRQCENIVVPKPLDIQTLAYGAVIAECVEQLTSEQEKQEEIDALLLQGVDLLHKHNKRLVTLSVLCKLLVLCGFAPELDRCTSCRQPLAADGFFSLAQGGFMCHECAVDQELSCSLETAKLLRLLRDLDLAAPGEFKVRGGALMEAERILVKFITYQTDRPLKSLDFLAQI